MNPFSENMQFDSRLYEVVSRIGKKNDKTKIKGLHELRDILDTIDVEGNIDTLLETIEDTIKSQDLQIRNLSIDVLYKLLSSVNERSKFKRVLSIWLYGFIENPEHATSKQIFNEFVNIEEIEDEFVQMVNFKENPVLGLICLRLLVKRGRKDYSRMIAENVKYLSLNSSRELREVYNLCKELGRVNELYEKIVMIKGPSLMNYKWRLLLDIFNALPKCIENDGKYLDNEVLCKAVERLDSCDDILVRNVDSLRIVFPKVKDKRGYMRRYLERGSIERLCILEFFDDFQFLNENVSFETVNKLVENVIKIHFQRNQDVEEIVTRMSMESLPRNLSSKSEENHEHTSPNGKKSILKTLLSSLDGLCGKRKIIRGDILEIELDPHEFTKEEIEDVFQHSVNVFPKDYILNSSFSCDLLPLVLKYPEEVGEERIRKTICKDNLHLFIPVCKDLDFLRSLMSSYDNKSMIEIYLSSDIPPALDLDFYYRLGDGIPRPRTIDYNRILERYLDSNFIRNIITNGVANRVELYNAVVSYLSLAEIPISTSYTSPFYDLDECFYGNVKIREQSRVILNLKNVYTNIYEGADEAFLLLLLDAMCDDEDESLDQELKDKGLPGGKKGLGEFILQDGSAVERWRSTDLGINQHFIEKVFFDLNLPSRRCGGKKIEELLEYGGPRAIDYILRKYSVPAQFIPSVDFSYLSNEALTYAVSVLENASKKGLPISLTEVPPEDQRIHPSGEEGVVDDHLLMSISRSNFKNLKTLGLEDIARIIEKDQLLSRKEYHKERYTIYSPLLRRIYNRIADSILNMYSISRLDTNSIDDEVYDLLRECFLGSVGLFWDFLLNSLLIVRNIRINAFFEKMIKEKEEWRAFLLDADLNQRSLFAFLFPNLFSAIPRMEVNLDSFILEEASRTIADVTVKTQKLTNGFDIRISYTAEGTLFKALVSIPSDYPYRKPVFTSEIGRKSLLNLKINEMIKKCSKFMELIGLWKVNIDEKISGHKECPICYLVIDLHDSSFPNSQCKACKNKFHARCIAKWVASGTRSNCPICRMPMENVS
ncbi:RING Zn-finger domain-containing protein [Encephalitozoon romaleae SJ-2008]|uniref:E3 ubiquitin-protein ligase listerin n=1 Tax=Encephalitozoon romaleae (strain SJ-2008) TaxID=1178016 RepID=I7AMS6_ENCRO|nr:RING Zn-finger domain-containing protein [Encephalitozoon romaleae SJ-2008]AFN83044.1 RING Zn-finger domain-containing protein [Encephalitozoon romaleae SJ-2008]